MTHYQTTRSGQDQPSWSQRKVTGLGWLFVLIAAIGLPYVTLKSGPDLSRRKPGRRN